MISNAFQNPKCPRFNLQSFHITRISQFSKKSNGSVGFLREMVVTLSRVVWGWAYRRRWPTTEAIASACWSGPHRSPQSDSSFHSFAPSEFQFQPSGHCASRKNKFPVGAVMVMLLIEPLVVTVKPEAVQFVVLKLLFCCKAKPLDG